MIGQDGGWVRASIGAEAKASLCISQGRVLRTLVDYQSPTQVRAHSLPEGSRGRTSRSASGARAKKEHGGHIILGISNIIIVGIRQVSNLALATAWYRIVAYFVDAHSLKLRKKQVLFLADQNVYSSIFLICSEWRAVCVNYSSCLTLHFFCYRTTPRNSVKDG